MFYYRDIEHRGLAKFRRIRGTDEYVLNRRAEEQLREWDRQWHRRQEIERTRNQRLLVVLDRDQKKALAARQTEEAKAEINELRQILAQISSLEEASWSSLYDYREFSEPRPNKPTYESHPAEPKVSDQQFQPKRSFFATIIPYLKRRRIKEAQDLWVAAHFDWQATNHKIAERNTARLADHKRQTDEWLGRFQAFKAAQDDGNQRIDHLRERYLNKDPDAVVEFTDLILTRSEYPSCFPKGFEIDFHGVTGVMVVDYDLPDVDRLPKLEAIKYVQARDAFENVQLKQRELDAVYEGAIYQTCLRTINENFCFR
jgi:restriction system protein